MTNILIETVKKVKKDLKARIKTIKKLKEDKRN